MINTQHNTDDMHQDVVGLVQDAIDRSESHNEIVSINFPGSSESLLELLHDLGDWDVIWVTEDDGDIDVWAGNRLRLYDGMVWRLRVNCSE